MVSSLKDRMMFAVVVAVTGGGEMFRFAMGHAFSGTSDTSGVRGGRLFGLMMITTTLLVATSTWAQITTTIDSNSFTFDTNVPDIDSPANDFHLEIDGNFIGTPSSDSFPNRTVTNNQGDDGTPTTATADFSGGTVKDEMSHNVKFKATGAFPSPRGQFTKDRVIAGGVVKSKALDGTEVAFVPVNGGFDVSLNLLNDFGAPLTGSVEVFVNSGFPSHFTLDEFDVLRDERPVFAQVFEALEPGQGFTSIQTHLASSDEYLLVRGSVDAGDGFGNFPFALAISPVPEPSGFVMLGIGIGTLFLARRRTIH